jgi:predicted dehydrogenase
MRRNGIPGTAASVAHGVLWDLGPHLIDASLGLFAEPTGATVLARIEASNGQPASAGWYADAGADALPPVVESRCFGSIFFDQSCALHMLAGWDTTTTIDRVEMCVVGDRGQIHVQTLFGMSPDRRRMPACDVRFIDTRTSRTTQIYRDALPDPAEYRCQLDDILGAGASREDGNAGAWRAGIGVALCEALARSARSAQAVRCSFTQAGAEV